MALPVDIIMKRLRIMLGFEIECKTIIGDRIVGISKPRRKGQIDPCLVVMADV